MLDYYLFVKGKPANAVLRWVIVYLFILIGIPPFLGMIGVRIN